MKRLLEGRRVHESSGKARVIEALQKPAPYGPDIDLGRYEFEEARVEGDPSVLSESGLERAAMRVGMDSSSPSYIQLNQMAIYRAIHRALEKYNVTIMPLREALEKLEVARELSWKLIKPETDKYTAHAYLYGGELGYFIYVPPRTKVPLPIYSCLAITVEKRVQFAHNVIYVGEGSEAHVVTGCSVPHGVSEGVHIGISEFYVGRNAKLTFSMVHAWARGLHVRPRTAARLESGGEFVNYYVLYSPVGSIQAYPRAVLEENAKTYMASIIAGSESGVYDLGSMAVLEGRGSSAEIVSRVVARDSCKIYARAEIRGEAPKSKGHIECLGLLLSNDSMISSIPIITSTTLESRISHEAAIGMIAQEELEYLMCKGFTEEEAKAILVRGFMSVEAPGIPSRVKVEMDKILDMVSRQAIG